MTKVESLNPLRTLHNSMPLKEMDSFFDRTAGQATEALVTPVSTPQRKPISKKLKASARSVNPTPLTEDLNSAGNEDLEGITDLLTEAVEKRDTWKKDQRHFYANNFNVTNVSLCIWRALRVIFLSRPKVAYLTVRSSRPARFARVSVIFVNFATVLVKSGVQLWRRVHVTRNFA